MARPLNTIRLGFSLVASVLLLGSCNTVDLYEKNASIPRHEWSAAFHPQFTFTIKDTSAAYQLYIVLRHNEKYNYNNIWLNLQAQAPGGAPQSFRIELPLSTSNNGWMGTAMDDLYEHRIPLTLDPEKFNFSRAGDYQFSIGQAMRDDPLDNVMNVGLRIEKKSR